MSNRPSPLAAVVAVAILVRGALVWTGAVQFGGDEAVMALMGRQILRSGAHPFFFYGQAYFGSLVAWLAAGAFWLGGESILSFRIVQAALYLGIVISTYCVALRIYGSRWMAGVAALLLAVPTVLITVYTSTSPGGYAESLLFGNLVLLLALKLGTGRRFWGDALLLGFFSGVGLWTFPMIAVYVVPALAYLAVMRLAGDLPGLRTADFSTVPADDGHAGESAGWQQPRHPGSWRWLPAFAGMTGAVRAALSSPTQREYLAGLLKRWAGEAGLMAAGAIVGSAPWWAYLWLNGWAALSSMFQPQFGAVSDSPIQSLVRLALLGPTVVIGLRPPWSIRLLALPLAPLAVGLSLALLAFLARRARAKNDGRWPGRLLLLGVAAMVLSAFVLTPAKVDPTGRHLLPLAVPAAILMAEFLHSLTGPHPALGRALALGLVVFQGWGMVQCATASPPGITAQLSEPMQINPQDVMAAAAFLKDNGETRGFTTYWLAYSLAFLSHEQVIFAARLPFQADMQLSAHDSQVYPAYTDLACQSPRVAYLTAHLPALDQRLREGLADLGVTYQEKQIGDLRVFYALSRKVVPQELGLGGGCGEP